MALSQKETAETAARVVCRLCKIWHPEVAMPWYKVAVPEYLEAADKAGLLTKDFLRRLKKGGDGEFRGAVGECLAAWFVERRLQPLGFERLRATQADMKLRLPGGEEACVEVKAPFPATKVHLDENGFGYGAGFGFLEDVFKKLKGSSQTAKGQLRGQTTGIVFIVLPTSVPARPSLNEAFASLFSRWGHEAEWVSGVLSVREDLGQKPIAIDAFLLHNPSAARPLVGDIWGDIPQCVFTEAQDSHSGLDWSWSDGERL